MSTLFVSHAALDSHAATRLQAWLVSQGFHSLFLDCHQQDGILPGARWEKELYRQLRRCDAVLALCSQHFAASRWCFAEVTFAKATGKAIVPLQLDDGPAHELLSEIQYVDFRRHATEPDAAYQALSGALARLGLERREGGPWARERSPYPGLTAFEEADASIYYGREADVAAVLAALRRLRLPEAARWLAILGASGSGKSSLLHAGMLPKLRADEREWLLVDGFRPGAQPLTRLAQALASSFARYGKTLDWKVLRETLRVGNAEQVIDLGEDLRFVAGAMQASVLLVIDQMEEALLAHRQVERSAAADEAGEFLAALKRLSATARSPFWVVFTLRSDFLDDLQDRPALQGLTLTTAILAPMSQSGFARVIRGPAEVAGLELEEGLVERMVSDTQTSDALPLLAFALRQLYEKHGDDRRLTIEEYTAPPPDGLGGLQGAVAQAGEDVLAHQGIVDDPTRLRQLRNCFLNMVVLTEHGEPARRPARWADLPAAAHPLLERFVQARLLVSREVDAHPELEVVHDALFRSWERLRNWLAGAGRFLLWRKELQRRLQRWQAAQEIESAQHSPSDALPEPSTRGSLLSGDDLVQAQANLERYADLLTTSERAYIEAGLAAASRRRWLVRALIGGTMLVLAAAAGFARKQSLHANERGGAAKRATLIAAARSFPDDPTRSGALFRETDQEHAAALLPTARILEGHEGAIRALALSPDGTLMVTGSDDHTARIWQVANPAASIVLRGHEAAIRVALFDLDGKRVLTGAEDGTARIWNVDGNGDPVVLKGHVAGIQLAAFDRDGSHVVTAPQPGRQFRLFGGDPPVYSVHIWDLSAPDVPRILTTDTQHALSVALSRDGELVALAAEGKPLTLWQTQSGSKRTLLKGAPSSITRLTFSDDAALVAAGTQRGDVYVWRLARPAAPQVILGGPAQPLTSLVFSPGATYLAGGFEHAATRIWRIEGSQPALVLSEAAAATTTLAFSPDNQFIVIGSANGKARIHRTDGSDPDPMGRLMAGALQSMTRTYDQFLDDTVALQPLHDLQRSASDKRNELAGHDARITAVAWSRDGRHVATTSADRTARLWTIGTAREPLLYLRSSTKPSGVALSRDGERLLEYHQEQVLVRNADGSGSPLVLYGNSDVTAAALSPDGDMVITGSSDRDIRLWDVAGSRAVLLASVSALPDMPNAVAFNAAGDVVLGRYGSELHVWSTKDRHKLVPIGRTAPVHVAAFTPDGAGIVVQSPNQLQLWRIADWKHLRRFEHGSPADETTQIGFRLTQDGRFAIGCAAERRTTDQPFYRRWDLNDDDGASQRLAGYSYDLVADALKGEGVRSLMLANDGSTLSDPCEQRAPPSLIARSPNGRRIAMSSPLSFDGDPQSVLMVVTSDGRTSLWRTIDHCISAAESCMSGLVCCHVGQHYGRIATLMTPCLRSPKRAYACSISSRAKLWVSSGARSIRFDRTSSMRRRIRSFPPGHKVVRKHFAPGGSPYSPYCAVKTLIRRSLLVSRSSTWRIVLRTIEDNGSAARSRALATGLAPEQPSQGKLRG
jgi:WD40 repeat protein